jgi:hypothetical protein
MPIGGTSGKQGGGYAVTVQSQAGIKNVRSRQQLASCVLRNGAAPSYLCAVQIFLIRVAGRIFDRLNAIAPVAATAKPE